MPKRLINRNTVNKIACFRRRYSAFKIITASICSASLLLVSNLPLLNAFESHIIEVTANICGNTETNMVGNWVENAEIYRMLIPQEIGDDAIDTPEKADALLNLANDANPRNQLKSQLLSLKFNIAYFEIGEYSGKNMQEDFNEIALEADKLLRMDPPPLFTELETMKINIQEANSSIRSGMCASEDSMRLSGSAASGNNEKILINMIALGSKPIQNNDTDLANYDWIQLYNSAPEAINIKDWKICNNSLCETLSENDIFVPEHGYGIIAENGFDINDWDIPHNVTIIILEDKLCDGLDSASEMLELKNDRGEIVDSVNWGSPDASWTNYNSNIWNPGIENPGTILKRHKNGLDTDSVSDWSSGEVPSIELTSPNSQDVWWIGRTYNIKWNATNIDGSESDIKINIWYSTDGGKTWANIATDTPNDGTYEWRMPLYIEDGYFTVSPDTRIKIVAINSDNFMMQSSVISKELPSPPIDFENLTSKETSQAIEIGLLNKDDDTNPIVNENFVSDGNEADELGQTVENANASAYIDNIANSGNSENDRLKNDLENQPSANNFTSLTSPGISPEPPKDK